MVDPSYTFSMPTTPLSLTLRSHSKNVPNAGDSSDEETEWNELLIVKEPDQNGAVATVLGTESVRDQSNSAASVTNDAKDDVSGNDSTANAEDVDNESVGRSDRDQDTSSSDQESAEGIVGTKRGLSDDEESSISSDIPTESLMDRLLLKFQIGLGLAKEYEWYEDVAISKSPEARAKAICQKYCNFLDYKDTITQNIVNVIDGHCRSNARFRKLYGNDVYDAWNISGPAEQINLSYQKLKKDLAKTGLLRDILKLKYTPQPDNLMDRIESVCYCVENSLIRLKKSRYDDSADKSSTHIDAASLTATFSSPENVGGKRIYRKT